MPIIKLELQINAPIERVFDLARSIDLHEDSLSRTGERAVGGRTNGLLAEGETVIWEARHLGITQRLSSKIVKYDRPNHFRDSMQKGVFSRFDHDHFFFERETGTMMSDVFDYRSPFSVFGLIADRLFLEKYMTCLLIERNKVIKQVAEGGNWRRFISEN
ncbi:MAG: SRPBCC family protein [Acidobacteria bacterium]|nr:SRPBCC family protein [Acidobacteriota bacterium]